MIEFLHTYFVTLGMEKLLPIPGHFIQRVFFIYVASFYFISPGNMCPLCHFFSLPLRAGYFLNDFTRVFIYFSLFDVTLVLKICVHTCAVILARIIHVYVMLMNFILFVATKQTLIIAFVDQPCYIVFCLFVCFNQTDINHCFCRLVLINV